MSEKLTEPTVDNLRRASKAVYLACEASVADDLSNLLKWAANELDRRASPQPEAGAGVTEEEIARELIAHGEFSSNPNYNYQNALQCARAILARIAQAGQSEAGSVTIAHDGFSGDIIGRYLTREGKRGVVVQQHGTRVVHVYGEKWLAPPNHPEVDRG